MFSVLADGSNYKPNIYTILKYTNMNNAFITRAILIHSANCYELGSIIMLLDSIRKAVI